MSLEQNAKDTIYKTRFTLGILLKINFRLKLSHKYTGNAILQNACKILKMQGL